MILLYVVCKDSKEAKKISSHLLQRKLAACTNAFPITSCFSWDNKQQNQKEVALLVKSQAKHQQAIETAVKRIHSYEIPCILNIPATANEEYHSWIHRQT